MIPALVFSAVAEVREVRDEAAIDTSTELAEGEHTALWVSCIS